MWSFLAFALDALAIAAQALGIGTVYQEVNLLENLTVAENLFLGRQPHRFGMIDRASMQKQSQALLTQYGLAIDVTALLSSYSVAIRQIIAIARAVDLSGKVLVLDEPFGALDAFTREELWCALRDIQAARGVTVMLVTHDLREAVFLADTVYVMSRRPGRIVLSKKIDIPRPRTLATTFEPHFVDIVHELRDRIHQEHS